MQLRVPERELNRLGLRIEENYAAAIGDHQRRMERFRRYYQKWRNRVDPPAAGEEEASNFSVPLVQWNVFQAWSRELQSLLGDDAEIIAKPTGPSDQRNVHKIGRYQTWRMFQSMRIVNPLAVFTFRKILFGRSHAYAPWQRDTFDTPQGQEVWYEGPGFTPLWPDDFIVPGEKDVQRLHDFSWIIRRVRLTPDQLLRGEAEGRYQGIKENFQKLVDLAENPQQREDEQIKTEADIAEGVDDGGLSGGSTIIVHEWYGRWRQLKGKADGRENNLDRRRLHESELVVKYIPELHLPVGVQDLMDLYPKCRDRRPFVESSLVKDGSYWSPSMGELLESIEDEASSNHNLFTEAGQFAVGPVIFAKPGSPVQDERFRYEPYTVIASEDPASVKVVNMQADLQYPIVKEQAIFGYAERVTGQSDMNIGRSTDRPNAPRTASGTIALIEEGNVRISLNTTFLREDMSIITGRFWELDSQFAPEKVFFRVTEEDAKGLFDVAQGGAFMTAEERGGRYDFDLKFATSVWSREARKQNQIALYQVAMQNPIVLMNPIAQWELLNKIFSAMGDDNLSDIVQRPPDMGQPKQAREEWTLMLQGEEVHVNPMDNDDLHLLQHYKQVNEAAADPRGRDEGAINLNVAHILEHNAQKRQKMLMQAMASSVAQSLAGNTAQTGGLMMPQGGIPAGLDQVRGAIEALGIGGRGPGAGVQGGQPGGEAV